MSITKLIKGLRVTDEVLARLVCVSASTVYRWRKGRTVPTPMARKALARQAGIRVEDVEWEKTK